MALTIAQIAETLIPKLPGIKTAGEVTKTVLIAELDKPEQATLKADYSNNTTANKDDLLEVEGKKFFSTSAKAQFTNTVGPELSKIKPQYKFDIKDTEVVIEKAKLQGVESIELQA